MKKKQKQIKKISMDKKKKLMKWTKLKKDMLMNIMIMELGMKDKPKMGKDMEKENSFIKLEVSMMGSGKMEKLME